MQFQQIFLYKSEAEKHLFISFQFLLCRPAEFPFALRAFALQLIQFCLSFISLLGLFCFGFYFFLILLCIVLSRAKRKQDEIIPSHHIERHAHVLLFQLVLTLTLRLSLPFYLRHENAHLETSFFDRRQNGKNKNQI